MKIANHRGEMPTKEQIVKLFEYKPIKIELISPWEDYEENIEFDHLQITFVDGQQLNLAGYCGMWELMHPEKLHEAAFNELVKDLKEWILYDYENDPEELELWTENSQGA